MSFVESSKVEPSKRPKLPCETRQTNVNSSCGRAKATPTQSQSPVVNFEITTAASNIAINTRQGITIAERETLQHLALRCVNYFMSNNEFDGKLCGISFANIQALIGISAGVQGPQ